MINPYTALYHLLRQGPVIRNFFDQKKKENQ